MSNENNKQELGQPTIMEPEDLLDENDSQVDETIPTDTTDTPDSLPALEPKDWDIETDDDEDSSGIPLELEDSNQDPINVIETNDSVPETNTTDTLNSESNTQPITYYFADNIENPVRLGEYRKGPYLPHLVIPNTIITDTYIRKGDDMYNSELNTYTKIKSQQNRVLTTEERQALSYKLTEYSAFNNTYGFGLLVTYPNSEHTHLLETREDKFNQTVVSSSGRRIGILSAASKNNQSDYLQGLDGLNYISGIINGGNSVRIPLWHSGLSITLGNFELDELGDFEILSSNIKASLGVDTHGNIYNSENVVIVGTILDFIFNKIQKTSVTKGLDIKKIGDILSVNDIPLILAGALEGIFPHGYPLVVGCVSSHQNNCNFTLEREKDSEGRVKPEGLLKFAKALWTDVTVITPTLAETMCSSNVTMDHVIAYKNNLASSLNVEKERVILEVDKLKLSIVFKVPTINEYRTAGNAHNRRINDKVTGIMSTIVDGDSDEDIKTKRKNMIEQFSQKMFVGEYLAWYEEIRIYINGDTKPKIVNNPKDFMDYLQQFTRYDSFKINLEKAYQEFRDDNIISLVGYNNFKCPVCGSNQVLDTPEDVKLWMGYNNRYPSIIPINLVNTFLAVVAYMSDTTQLT